MYKVSRVLFEDIVIPITFSTRLLDWACILIF